MALYAAKGAGRNDYRIFGSDMVRTADAPPLAPDPTPQEPSRKTAAAS